MFIVLPGTVGNFIAGMAILQTAYFILHISCCPVVETSSSFDVLFQLESLMPVPDNSRPHAFENRTHINLESSDGFN